MNYLMSIVAVFSAMAAAVAAADGAFMTWRGDSSLAGVVDTKVPDAPVRLWTYPTGWPVTFPPVAGDGKVFVAGTKGRVTALDMSGKKVWSKTIEEKTGDTNNPVQGVAFTAPPSYAFGTLLLATSGGEFIALDGQNGNEKWKAEVGGPVQGCPNFADMGKEGWLAIAIAQPDGTLAAFDGATGKEKWRSEPNGRVDGHIAVSGGRIAFGGCDSTIHVLAVSNGSNIAAVPLGEGCEIAGGVAMAGGMVYSGSRGGALCAVDIARSELKWKLGSGGGELFTTPAATDKVVVFSAGNGTVTAVDLADTGKAKWEYDGGGVKAESPIIAGDRVVVAIDGKVRILDLNDGRKPVWTSPSVGDGVTSPAVVDGMIIVGSDAGSVVAFGAKQPAAEVAK